MKIVKIPKGRITPSAEFKPADRSVAQRIKESIVSHIPLEQSGVPFFDEEPGKPNKSMDVDPLNDPRMDNLDRAQSVLDYYGAKVDAERVAREAAAKPSADPAAIAAETEQTDGEA